MNKSITAAIYPGTFDPITCGHLDVIERAAAVFDRVVIAVFDNRRKQTRFDLAQRVELIRASVNHLDGVEVDAFADRLLADYARERGIQTIVRGLRAVTDFDYELSYAQINRKLSPTLETVFFMTSIEHAFLSSTMVKELADLGGDVSSMVPPPVRAALQASTINTDSR